MVEQLAQLTNSSLWPRVAEIRYATVGNGAIDGFIQKICRKRRLPCVRLGHSDVGSELNTLAPLHAFCREARQAPPALGPARHPARHTKNAVYQESQTRPAGLRGHGRGVHAGANGALGGDSITH